MDIWVATLIVVFSVMIILWQIFLVFQQKIELQKFKNDYMDFKATIEGILKQEVNEIISQNKKLINAINEYFKTKN